MSLYVQPTAEMTSFRRSDLCQDITKALHNLLAKGRHGLAPDHDSPFQRYHIVNMVGRKPILGSTMQFETCDREHGVGYCHPDLMCSDPNESAMKYMDKFLSDTYNFLETDLSNRKEVDRLFVMYRDPIPSRYIMGWSNVVRNIFLDLHKATEWVPEIHGVLYWMPLIGFADFAKMVFHEIMVIRAIGNMGDCRRIRAGRREFSE